MAPDDPTAAPAAAPSPDNNFILRQMAGMRRDMHALMEMQARSLEAFARTSGRTDEVLNSIAEETQRIRRDVSALRSDMLLMENRVITAITEVRELAARLDQANDSEYA